MGRPRLYLEIFLVCLAVLLLEVSYTRVFSFKLVYYFTYLIIGIALLGIGSGGVLVALAPRLRGAAVERLVPVCALVAALGVLGGYVVVARTQFNSVDLVEALVALDAGKSLAEGAKLAAICTALFIPFLAGGLAIAAIFASRSEFVNRLYFADLLGAAIGCAVSVPLMTWLSPPACVMLAGGCFALAGLRLALDRVRLAVPGLGIAALAALTAALLPGRLPDVVTDRIKTMAPQQTPESAFSRWHPVFRVDVLKNSEKVRDGLMLAHDGMWGSVLPRYDGDAAALTRYDTDVRSVPFRVLEPAPRVAIIGAAGGNEILASLHFGAKHIDAVELNPVTVALLTDYFKDYTGRMAEDPHVDVVNAEGRGFLMRDDSHYDLIWFVAPDSYAAMNAATSGAYVLSESYLYTKEMLLEALDSLTPDGVVCTQFGEPSFEKKPNRTARYLATVRAAFADLGVADAARHVLVATSSGFVFTTSTILIKREPFTQKEIDDFVRTVQALPDGKVRHAPGVAPDDHPVSRILTLSGPDLAAWLRSYPFDVRAVSDDAPFFWHFVRFRHALRRSAALRPASLEEGMGERLLVVLLVVATSFAAVFLLAPLAFARRVWRTIPHKALAGTYFAALGFGFMFLEVSLIQRLTLFLG